MDALEAEAEAIMEMVGRRGNQLQSQSSSEAPELSGAESNVDGNPGQSVTSTDGSANAPSTSETPMDVDQPGK